MQQTFLGGIDKMLVQKWQQMYATAMERLEKNDREDQFSGSLFTSKIRRYSRFKFWR